jgi:hypothetical protein
MAAPTKIPAYGSWTADTVANFTASGRIWEDGVPLYINSGPGMGGLKIGDGEHTWAQLPWFASGGGGSGGIIPAVDSGVNPPAGSVSIWAPPPPNQTCLGLRYSDGTVAFIWGGEPPPPSGSFLTLNTGASVNITPLDLNSAGLYSTGTSTDTIIVNGQNIVKSTVISAIFGVEFNGVTALEANFLNQFSNLTTLDLSGFTSLTSIGDYFLYDCDAFNKAVSIPSGVTSIGSNFLAGCASFNKAITLSPNLASIGSNFLYTCAAFNTALTLPSSLASIGDSFLSGCTSFNKPLTLLSSVTEVGTYFLRNCSALVSAITINCPASALAGNVYSFSMSSASALAYTTGMTIAGPYAAAILAKFPNSVAAPFRKLLNGGPSSNSYLTLNNGAQVPLTASNLTALCTSGAAASTIIINGQSIVKNTVVGARFGMEFGGVTSIPDYFLYYFTSLTALYTSGLLGVLAIGDYCLGHCSSFNQQFDLPLSLTSIGYAFMEVCTSFNKSVIIPDGVTSVGMSFMEDCNSMVQTVTIDGMNTVFADDPRTLAVHDNTVAAYTHGITIDAMGGQAIVDAFRAQFPNNDVSPWRKLLGGTPPPPPSTSWLTLADGTQVAIAASDISQDAGLCSPGGSDATITVSGGQVVKNQVTGAKFAAEFNNVQQVPNHFLYNFSALTSLDLSGFTSLTSIGMNFMSECIAFNQPFTIPPSVTSIGSGFFVLCTSFNQPLTIPAWVQSVGEYFLNGCDNLTAPITINCAAGAIAADSSQDESYPFSVSGPSVPAYTQGMAIAGPNTAGVLVRFPNGSGPPNPYRKLTTYTPPPSYLVLNGGPHIPIVPSDLSAISTSGSSSSAIIIGGQPILKNQVTGAVFGADFNGVDAIPDYFLYNFVNLTTFDFSGFLALQTIGGYFLGHCGAVNAAFTLPSTLTSIGYAFMELCTSFNKPLTVPATVTAVGMSFMEDCEDMVSTVTINCPASVFATDPRTLAVHDNTVPAYAEGITIAGSNVDAFRARFPNNDVSPWRKLLGGTPPVPSSSYLALSGGTQIPMTAADLDELCNTASTITVGGQTIAKSSVTGAVFGTEFNGVTALPANFLYSFPNLTGLDPGGFTSLQTIGDYFLANCYNFNQPLTVPAAVTGIGSNFMYSCIAFDSALTLPSNLASIGDSFLVFCPAFNKPLTIPATVTGIGTVFLAECNNMVSPITINCPAVYFTDSNVSFATESASAPAYTTGMTIAGPNAADVLLRFPPSDVSPFRKLIAYTPPSSPSYITLNTGANIAITPDDLTNTGLCAPGGPASSITVGGQTVVKNTVTGAVFGADFNGVDTLPDYFLFRFTNLTALDLDGFTSLIYIGHYFLSLCTSFNAPLTVPSTVTVIGIQFLAQCTAFNGDLTLPPYLGEIGAAFLSSCPSFNKPFTVPQSVGLVGVSFLDTVSAMTATVTINTPAASFADDPYSFSAPSDSDPAYTTGIGIAGPNTAEIMAKFPNSDDPSSLRKLRAVNAAGNDTGPLHTPKAVAAGVKSKARSKK